MAHDSDVARLARAYALAARAHARQTRKGQMGIPYINHPCEVAELVASAGADAETVIAAVLHDVVEDSELRDEDLRAAFGSKVADLVAALTDAPDWEELPRPEKKARQAAHLRSAPPDAKRIKIADQTSNLHDVAREPDAWSTSDAREYIEGTVLVVGVCRGTDAALEAEFDRAARDARSRTGAC